MTNGSKAYTPEQNHHLKESALGWGRAKLAGPQALAEFKAAFSTGWFPQWPEKNCNTPLDREVAEFWCLKELYQIMWWKVWVSPDLDIRAKHECKVPSSDRCIEDEDVRQQHRQMQQEAMARYQRDNPAHTCIRKQPVHKTAATAALVEEMRTSAHTSFQALDEEFEGVEDSGPRQSGLIDFPKGYDGTQDAAGGSNVN